MKNFLTIGLIALSVFACAPRVKPPSAPVLTPEQMQKNMMEAGAVRTEHALLKKLAGNWKVESKIWMDPNGAPEVTKGTATSKLLYGGRYLTQNFKGSFMGKPFEGQSTMGFDNLSGQYFSTWIDSFSTMLMQSSGTAHSESSIVLASNVTCPLTRETMQGEDVITIIDNNHYRFEAFQNREGKKVKGMEILYSRVK